VTEATVLAAAVFVALDALVPLVAVVSVVVVAATALPEALVTGAVNDAVATEEPVDPVCQMAVKATANVVSRVAATRRRIIEMRRARVSSLARAVARVVSVVCMRLMLKPVCAHWLGAR